MAMISGERKLYRRILIIVPVIGFLLILHGCDDTTTGDGGDRVPLPGPSHDLPAADIMALQKIHSIHYIKFMRLTINGIPDSGYHPAFEYYLDTGRVRIHDYDRDEIFVYDKSKNIAWQYYQGTFQYITPPDIPQRYNTEARYIVGSWLDESRSYVRSEIVDNKSCDVFSDTTGAIEWIWTSHRLPIQLYVDDYFGSTHLVNEIQMRSLEVNIQLPDSVFLKP